MTEVSFESDSSVMLIVDESVVMLLTNSFPKSLMLFSLSREVRVNGSSEKDSTFMKFRVSGLFISIGKKIQGRGMRRRICCRVWESLL